jgi:hypothetical protein
VQLNNRSEDVAPRIGFWADHRYNLSRMSMRELVGAYLSHYAVAAYFLLGAIGVGLAAGWTQSLLSTGLAAVAAVIAYPVVWYVLHRFVLHSRLLYKSPLTAKLWKRIHFDHHQDPHDLGVLFGALYTTLPTIALVTGPLGYAIGGPAGAAAAMAAALFTTCFYEFIHSAQHLNYRPKSKVMQEMKRLHLLHHFHSERGNHGITNFLTDRLLGTYYARARDLPKSATVFNLGYDEIEAQRYPWVAELSGGIRTGSNGRRWQPGQPIAGAEAVGADLDYAETPRGQAA